MGVEGYSGVPHGGVSLGTFVEQLACVIDREAFAVGADERRGDERAAEEAGFDGAGVDGGDGVGEAEGGGGFEGEGEGEGVESDVGGGEHVGEEGEGLVVAALVHIGS